MRIDPFNWSEVSPTETHHNSAGRLRLKASRRVAVFVEVEGYEVLAGTGFEVDLEYPESFRYRVDGPDDARVFVYSPRRAAIESSGERYTNIDRKPHESGSVLEVRRAIRDMQILHQQQRRELREEARRLRRQGTSSSKGESAQPVEPGGSAAPVGAEAEPEVKADE